MLKKSLVGVAGLLLVLGVVVTAFLYWATAFFPSNQSLEKLRSTKAENLEYLQAALPPGRGRILAIVTSVKTIGSSGKITGYELSELARAYWVFTANGFVVDIASPQGGEPYALLDEDDMAEFDYAFLNDPIAREKMKSTLKLSQINPDHYVALYFVGGKGAMFDFPENPDIHHLVSKFDRQGKMIAAVCHGPAALVNVKRADGSWLVANKKVSAFTNSEELLLLPDAQTLFPFLLQTRLEERGAQFMAGTDYLQQVVQEGNLITGQNPWSVWLVAETMVKQLGYEPLARALTAEEQSILLLQVYYDHGLSVAEKRAKEGNADLSGQLVLMHSFVAAMRGDFIDMIKLLILADTI